MVFHLDGEPLFARNEAGAAGHRPAFHHAVEFEPEIVMQPCGGMFLDNESAAAALAGFAPRFRGDAEAALGPIGLKRPWYQV
jgi:hypothetical protein